MDGEKHGTVIDYYENGTKSSETPYVDGNANGTAIKYRRNGSKVIYWYMKHRKQSEVWYREDGSKWKEMPYKGFVFHGTAVSYHKDGSIKEETPWVNGKVQMARDWVPRGRVEGNGNLLRKSQRDLPKRILTRNQANLSSFVSCAGQAFKFSSDFCFAELEFMHRV